MMTSVVLLGGCGGGESVRPPEAEQPRVLTRSEAAAGETVRLLEEFTSEIEPTGRTTLRRRPRACISTGFWSTGG